MALGLFAFRMVQCLRYLYHRRRGHDIHPSCEMERWPNGERHNLRGMSISVHTTVTSGVSIISQKLITSESRSRYTGDKVETHTGRFCVIGIGAAVMGGVTIRDEATIGAGAVDTEAMPPNGIVAGNLAHFIRSGITTKGHRL